jgi:hypothetical protein
MLPNITIFDATTGDFVAMSANGQLQGGARTGDVIGAKFAQPKLSNPRAVAVNPESMRFAAHVRKSG